MKRTIRTNFKRFFSIVLAVAMILSLPGAKSLSYAKPSDPTSITILMEVRDQNTNNAIEGATVTYHIRYEGFGEGDVSGTTGADGKSVVTVNWWKIHIISYTIVAAGYETKTVERRPNDEVGHGVGYTEDYGIVFMDRLIPVHEVTFNPANGELSTTVSNVLDGTLLSTIAPADPLKANTVHEGEITGYTFEGWSTDGAATGVVNAATYIITATQILTAYYSSYFVGYEHYTVTFKNADGSVFDTANDVLYNTALDTLLPENDPEKAHETRMGTIYQYTFRGWSSDGTVGGIVDHPETFLITEDRILRAVFDESIFGYEYYTVRFLNEDGSWFFTAADNLYGTRLRTVLPPTNPTKPDAVIAGYIIPYIFTGWELDEHQINVLKYEITRSIDLRALFRPDLAKGYVVTYELNGGMIDGTNPDAFYYSNLIFLSPAVSIINPTKVGYTFTGWDGNTSLQYGPYAHFEAIMNFNLQWFFGPTYLEATWEANSYDVTYHYLSLDADGVTINEETEVVSVLYDSILKDSAPNGLVSDFETPTMSYDFSGNWSLVQDGTEDIGTMLFTATEGLDVYAIYDLSSIASFYVLNAGFDLGNYDAGYYGTGVEVTGFLADTYAGTAIFDAEGLNFADVSVFSGVGSIPTNTELGLAEDATITWYSVRTGADGTWRIEGFINNQTYTLLIHYLTTGGATAAPDYFDEAVPFGTEFDITSPTVVGYLPDETSITGIMAGDNEAAFEGLEFTVTYTAQVVPFLVTFVDGLDAAVLKYQNVFYGGAATAPIAPDHDGYDFTGWDVAYDDILGDLTVTALYAPIVVTIPVAPTPAAPAPEEAPVEIPEEAPALAAEVPETPEEEPAVEEPAAEETPTIEIGEEEVPLASVEETVHYIFWILLLVILVYTSYAVARSVSRNKKINHLEDEQDDKYGR